MLWGCTAARLGLSFLLNWENSVPAQERGNFEAVNGVLWFPEALTLGMQIDDRVAVPDWVERFTVGITLNATFDASPAVGIGSIGGIRLIALMTPMVPMVPMVPMRVIAIRPFQ